jgi:hypothetical protein
MPDLARLAERSVPKPGSTDGGAALKDILKLRESGEAAALPVLAQILHESKAADPECGWAAAQALFCIGTPEARSLLSHLPQPFNPQAINRTVDWEMREPGRQQFLEQYLLRSRSTNLALILDCQSFPKRNFIRIQIGCAFRNTSNGPLTIHTLDDYLLGRKVFLLDAAGRVASRMFTGGDADAVTWLVLKPGESRRFEARAELELGETPGPEGESLMLSFYGTRIYVNPGVYRMFLVHEEPPMTRQAAQFYHLDPHQPPAWSGHVLSSFTEVNLNLLLPGPSR